MLARIAHVVLLALTLGSLAQATVITQAGSTADLPGSTDIVLNLFTPIGTPADGFTVTTSNGTVITVKESGILAIGNQDGPGCPGWVGHFAPPCTPIMSNQFGGDVTFTFSAGIKGFGTAMDDAFQNFLGGYIEAFSDTAATSSLGQFSIAPFAGLVFAGVVSSTPEIRAIVLHDQSSYFAFGTLSVVEQVATPPGAPEPSAALLVLGGLALIPVRRWSLRRSR